MVNSIIRVTFETHHWDTTLPRHPTHNAEDYAEAGLLLPPALSHITVMQLALSAILVETRAYPFSSGHFILLNLSQKYCIIELFCTNRNWHRPNIISVVAKVKAQKFLEKAYANYL